MKTAKVSPADQVAHRSDVRALAAIGLHEHDTVRFRRDPRGRWIEGTASSVESDGSLGLRDARGRRRSIRIEDVEVAARGPRGGRIWIPLCDIASADEQLGLF